MSNIIVLQVMKHILVVKIDTTLSTLMKQVNWNYYICVAVIDDDNLFGIITRQLIGYATKKTKFQYRQGMGNLHPGNAGSRS